MNRRAYCERCLRPQIACLCRWITPTLHDTALLILQHPLEVHHAKGSARLLHLSLSHSDMITGEIFNESRLHAALYADGKTPLLLYPSNAATTPPFEESGVRAPVSFSDESDMLKAPDSAQIRLIALDATWRKSRKMLYQNPLLQRLPRWSLRESGLSRYSIRKAHKPDQLSTLEACCHALAQFDNDVERYVPLLTAFDGFVAQQWVFRSGEGQIEIPT